MRRVVAYVPDLMDRSRLAAPGVSVTFVASPAALAGVDADLVVVDLGRPGVLDVLGELDRTGVPVIGFASHVDRDLMTAARDAGCGQVLARSAFFSRIRELLTGVGG
jgi:hypothetical protein